MCNIYVSTFALYARSFAIKNIFFDKSGDLVFSYAIQKKYYIVAKSIFESKLNEQNTLYAKEVSYI